MTARVLRSARWVAALSMVLILSACTSWRGVAGVPLPGGPGSGEDRQTIYVQMPDALAINVNSKVRVADVFVGRVRAVELRKWVPTLTLDVDPQVVLPANAIAKIGQTSLLGSQHVELAAPADPSPERLANGSTIPLSRSSASPTTERTLASIAIVLRGGGITNLESIQNEVNALFDGRADEIRQFLTELAEFTREINRQRAQLVRAVDSFNELLSTLAKNDDTIKQTLTDFPPLIDYFAKNRDVFADATASLGTLSHGTQDVIQRSRADLDRNLALLQRPLKQLGLAAPFVPQALRVSLTAPFNINDVDKVVRGDYINISGGFDLTLSSIDNALLTGTGFSGALRALEQSWGRDPATMIPDVRFSPNPADLPPERGE